MEWLNIHFIEPSTEEGDLLSSLERPWEDEIFWPYLTRSVRNGFFWANDVEFLFSERHYVVCQKLRYSSWMFYPGILRKIFKN
jgi:nuclear pore complex protein Nup85